MKRVILAIAFVAIIFSAKAWTGIVNGASYVIAKKYMTEQARAEYNRLVKLRETVDYKWVADKSLKVSLDADLRSTTTDEGDVVVRIERAIEVLKNSANYSEKEQFVAFENLRRLLIELHTISTIAIEGVEHSQHDFEFTWSGNREGPSPDKRDKYETRGKLTWSKMWSSSFCGWHQGWSSNYYAYDIDLRFGRIREQAMQGSVRDWAHEMGTRAKPLYEWVEPGMLMRNEPRLNLEELHLEMVTRAGYRLAAIMNNIVK